MAHYETTVKGNIAELRDFIINSWNYNFHGR